jgi:phosphate transport system protein
MSVHFDQNLDELKQRLITMASKAATAVDRAIQALVERDDDLARQVIAGDTELDDLEVAIDELGIQLLSKAPLAGDLRLITVAMKFGQNLERVGDEATTIARRAIELGQEPQLKPYVDIPRMARLALDMLHEALEAFIRHEPARALDIIPRDKQVDALNKQLHRELASFMIERPDTITRCLNLMVISKALERVADHAKNLAEEVVYLYEGRDVRHKLKPAPPNDLAEPAPPASP